MSGTITPNQFSLRERIMEHLRLRFAGVQAGANVTLTDGRVTAINTTWNTVSRRPLTKEQLRFGNALALFDVSERKEPETLFNRVHLGVVIEFFDAMKLGEEPSTALNRMLMDVQHIMMMDIFCGGLSLDIRETGNELSVDGPGDNLLGGMARFEVIYRHRAASPRLPASS